MSAMEPDEGTGADAPRWEKTEAANPPRGTDAPRWERADADAVDDDTNDTDESDDGTDSTDSTDS
jgi:hypothetical protein